MSELIIHESDDGKAQVKFRAMDGSLWLSQLQLAELYGVTVANINIHLRKIVQEEELASEAVIKQDLIPAADGKHYRLDMVLAVGYRVCSVRRNRGKQPRAQSRPDRGQELSERRRSGHPQLTGRHLSGTS